MKKSAHAFDVAEAALETGITHLEASAGTGKTYALTALCLRLVAEADLEIGSILVTTFTKPATAQLRERVRKLLRAAVTMFEDGPGDDSLLQALHPRYVEREAEIRPRLERALQQFDGAIITTIHGFCLRMLEERAFESGVTFDAEPIEDQQLLLEEVAADYWRLRIYPAELRLGAFASLAKLDAASLSRLLQVIIARPTMTVLPPHEESELPAAEQRMRTAFAAVEKAWNAGEAEVHAIFAQAGSWAKGEMKKPEATQERLLAMGRCLAHPGTCSADYESLEFFTAENVVAQTAERGKPTPPRHTFFDACSEFLAAREHWATAFQREFLAWAPGELAGRKLQRNLLSYDDLLLRLLDALRSDGGKTLVAAVRKRFGAALIDEFQDTDPVQAEIFTELFAGHGRLYFIGDPKQAIYGFRGADVFSYLDAAARAEHRHDLAANQRSVSPLVSAVNAIFARNPRAFLVEGIDFQPVSAAGREDVAALKEAAGVLAPPFRFWIWPSEKPIAKGLAEERLPMVVAGAIVEQMHGELCTEGRRLKPSDFAVLTVTNGQAQEVQRALVAAGVPAVVLSNQLVLQSPEAAEMLAIVNALATPTYEAAVRGALATTALGSSAAELAGLSEEAWERLLETFILRRAQWEEDGFFPAFRTLLAGMQVRPRLLALPDGERRLTNLLHLAELLHHAATAERLGPEALVRWLAVRMHPDSAVSAEHELRLESDDEAVKVVTVHKSKGLEFGIVWCPFSWGGANLHPGAPVAFHDPQTHGRVLHLHPEATHRALAEHEELAEKTRLLYVALTRARLQCHFVWGRFNKGENSAPAWILHPPGGAAAEAVPSLRGRVLDDATLRRDLAALAEEVPGAFAVGDLPEPVLVRYRPPQAAEAPRQARVFRGVIRRDWAIGSFSSLTAAVDPERPDHDAATATAEPASVATGIHAFPRGRHAGTCLHEIFEELDYQADDAGIEALVARKLPNFGFHLPDFRSAVAENVRRTLAVELAAGLRLSTIPASARLHELEFHLPAGRLDTARLREVLDVELPFTAFSGFLKGFIDLIFEHEGRFHLVDWKSNWLGRTAEDYTPEAIAAEMRRHHYTVQYHLYTVALHRYLSRRVAGYDYARHMGGVFYVFLRGVEPRRPELGIFRDQPDAERVMALDQLLATEP